MDISNAIASAQQLMLNENFWSTVDSMTPGSRNGVVKSYEGKMFDNEDFGNVEDASSYLNEMQYQRPQQPRNPNPNIPLPFSMSEEYKGMVPESYLYSHTEKSNTPVQRKQQIKENLQYKANNGGAVDYNYIKYLIDESIKGYFENNKLNESKGSICAGMRLMAGNKFQFLDTKGNLYEGVLTLKKKAENK